jgi:predicted PurR-regulated permease PerM
MENQKIWRTVLFSAAWTAGAFLALRFLGPVLLPFGVGLLFALAADPAVSRLQRQLGLPRWASAGIGITGLYLILALLLVLLCRLLWQELTAFVGALPQILSALSDTLTGWKRSLLALSTHLPEELAERLPCAEKAIANGIARVVTKAMTVKQMHVLAAQLRAEGAKVFFAGIEE